jgi:hypothetical protein
VRDDIPIDSETLLITDFVNLKIKSTQSFVLKVLIEVECACVFIEMSAHTYMNIYVCTVFLNKSADAIIFSSTKQQQSFYVFDKGLV